MDSYTEISKCIVYTKDGAISGYLEETEDGSNYKFKSIPYAKPPLGSLRFLPPNPIKPWEDIKDCTKVAPLPLQYYMRKEIIGSEDCLYMEVSTPNLQQNEPLPVMFWIGCHAFTFSLDPIYDPSFLNHQGVVFVRCGFRLGPFGFLAIHDFTAPGNCGLKDIVMALRWVQRNISAFGGDANNVTLFGSSAGAAIVHLMILSPMASGLFHKAIIQSSSALNNWSLAKNPTRSAVELARHLGIEKTYKIDIIEELRLKSSLEIMKSFVKMVELRNENERDIVDAMVKPCIELEFESQPAFLTKSPATYIKMGFFNRVPLIIGSINIEASVPQLVENYFYNDFEKLNENIDLLVPRALAADTKQSKSIGRQLLKFYLDGEEELKEDTKTQYLQLIGDYYFLYYINKTVRLHIRATPTTPIYYYIINHAGKWAVPDLYNFFNSLGHNVEVPFIFGLKMPNSPICKGSKDSVKTRVRVVKMWTNFAKFGNPTPDDNDPILNIKWEPVESEEKLNYLSIASELTKGTNPFSERMAFWDDLHKEHTFLRVLVYFNDMGISW